MDECGAGSIQLELKYCERCGALWLRPKSSDLVFCRFCAKALAGLMSLPRSTYPGEEGGPPIQDFWTEGGNA